MPASTDSRALPTPLPPLNPEKRAKAIRDAIAKRKIKPTSVIGDILDILDQIVAQEVKQSA